MINDECAEVGNETAVKKIRKVLREGNFIKITTFNKKCETW